MYCRLRGVHRGVHRGAGEATVTSSNTRVAGPLNYVEGHVKATGRYWGPMNHSYYSEGSIELRRGACKATGVRPGRPTVKQGRASKHSRC